MLSCQQDAQYILKILSLTLLLKVLMCAEYLLSTPALPPQALLSS
jgi:hypothetical protein